MITRILTLVAWLMSAAPAGAQRPAFGGEWTRIVDSTTARPSVAATGDAAFRRGDMGSGWGSPLLIRQTGDSLIVEYAHFSTYDLQPRLRFAYALDGSESRNMVMISHAGVLERSRVAWMGDTLVITTIFPAPAAAGGRPGTSTLRQALSLAPDGTLVIETAREGAAPVHTSYRKR